MAARKAASPATSLPDRSCRRCRPCRRPRQLIPSAGSLVPSWGTSSRPRAPERISGNLYRVYAGDRQIEDPIQRENYALLRAAESTKQVGATHFVVVNAPEGLPQQPTPPSSALIRVLQLETGAEPPVGAIAADEIIHFFGPAFGRAAQAGSRSFRSTKRNGAGQTAPRPRRIPELSNARDFPHRPLAVRPKPNLYWPHIRPYIQRLLNPSVLLAARRRCRHTRLHAQTENALQQGRDHRGAGASTPRAMDGALDTFPKLLLRNAERFGDRPAYRFKDLGIWQTWTWREVRDQRPRLRRRPQRPRPEARRPHRHRRLQPPAPLLDVPAAQSLGAVPVPVYADSVADELAYVLDHAEVVMAVVEDQEQVDKLLSIADRVPRLTHSSTTTSAASRNTTTPGCTPSPRCCSSAPRRRSVTAAGSEPRARTRGGCAEIAAGARLATSR